MTTTDDAATSGPQPTPDPVQQDESTGRLGDNRAGIAAVTAVARARLRPDAVIDDHARLRTYECDGLTHYRVTPALVVLPETTADVEAVVGACAQHGVRPATRASTSARRGIVPPPCSGTAARASAVRASTRPVAPVMRSSVLSWNAIATPSEESCTSSSMAKPRSAAAR